MEKKWTCLNLSGEIAGKGTEIHEQFVIVEFNTKRYKLELKFKES